jgi:hypothetical protein
MINGVEYHSTAETMVDIAGKLQAAAANAGMSLADYLKANPGTILAGSAADGNNTLYGGTGNDIVIGGGGRDVIYAGAGNDVLFGGGGNDVFAWKAADLDGGTDYIGDFQIGHDGLCFEGLLGAADLAHIADLLTGGGLNGIRGSLQATDADTLTLTLRDGGNNVLQVVQMHLENNSAFTSPADRAAFNASATAQGAMLEQLVVPDTALRLAPAEFAMPVAFQGEDSGPGIMAAHAAPAASQSFEAEVSVADNGTVMLTVSTRFDAADGAQHIILIEAKEGWSIEEPDGYTLLSSNYVLDGVAYCRLAVNDASDIHPTLTVILTPETPAIGAGGMDITVGSLSLYANGDSIAAVAEEPLAVAWNNTARIVFNEGAMEGVAGEDLQFRLGLQNGNRTMHTATAIALHFVVTCDTGDFRAPDSWMLSESVDSGGNTLSWSRDAATGHSILTATLSPGQSALDVSFEAFHTGGLNGIIDPNQTLHLTLKSVSALDGAGYPVWPEGLDPVMSAGDSDHPFTLGDQIAFTVVDAEYAQVAAYGIGHEADGMALAQVDASGVYDGSHFEQGQVIVGSGGDDTIYATRGNDILVGGGGNDT